jgi:hypothetical protein
MIDIPIASHEFRKVNVTTVIRGSKAYDIYRCEVCGLEGKRYGFSDLIRVNRDVVRCKARLAVRALAVRINPLHEAHLKSQFGLSAKIAYPIVEPLEEYKGKYPESVWVFSEKRGEPVRLLPGEFMYTKKDAEQ